MYHIHLLHSSLEDDPFRKSQNGKSNFPPPGPAEQTGNPKIKHSLSPSSCCSNVFLPEPITLLCSWVLAAMAVASALGGQDTQLRRPRAKRYSAPVYPSSLIYQTQAGEKQLTFSGRYMKEKKKCSSTNRLQWAFQAH